MTVSRLSPLPNFRLNPQPNDAPGLASGFYGGFGMQNPAPLGSGGQQTPDVFGFQAPSGPQFPAQKNPVGQFNQPAAEKTDPPNTSDQAYVYYALGERYYQANHFTHAIEAFTDCIRFNPTDYNAYNKRGVAKATTKDYAGAFADYTRAIAIKPDFYKAYINRGNLWVYLGALAHKRGNENIARQSALNAWQDFSQAIRMNPRAGAAYENRAELYTNLGMRQAALQDKGLALQIARTETPRPLGLPFCPPRIALVMANDDYWGTENDLNGGPVRDAGKIAQMLRSEGFTVITGNNLTGTQAKMKVAEFITKLQENPNAVSLVYYSGHGGSINGNNYLIPVNYSGAPEQDFASDAVSVDYLLKQLKATNSYFNMIFLDACRTPLPENSAAFKSAKPALKQWETEPGPGLSNTWIEYASRPKQPAMQDNNEGLYTKYLLQNMARPDLSLKAVCMETAFALEQDPIAIRENQHSRTQTDLSRTEPFAKAFCFADPCAINRARQQAQLQGQNPTNWQQPATPQAPLVSVGA